ncbi:hypothetical protein A8F94_14285 [Bacillus sp. FJAT-27225]|uniref:hypothetical protein n=1 Tax=Bacillus sp. FJAT-27225 TaxID=1743144 RepID=UPI00080C34D8|nr:hypothetical protein [Bacillus sp. FJAT-27225]OCA86009.1 hypothetical protein A8F94_14285 [Bacillus sp. FJAT-27225]
MFVVTGLTNMSGERVCMSVYDTEAQCYRRPISQQRITQYTVQNIRPFSIVNLVPIPQGVLATLPHIEDVHIQNTPIFREIGRLDQEEQELFLSDISENSVLDIFGHDFWGQPYLNEYRGKFYVRPNQGIRSLGTIEVDYVRLYEDNFNNRKLKVDFTDMLGNFYSNIPYVSIEQNGWQNRNDFINTFNYGENSRKFVRLSLARAFRPDNWHEPVCFLQVSCIHIY